MFVFTEFLIFCRIFFFLEQIVGQKKYVPELVNIEGNAKLYKDFPFLTQIIA